MVRTHTHLCLDLEKWFLHIQDLLASATSCLCLPLLSLFEALRYYLLFHVFSGSVKPFDNVWMSFLELPLDAHELARTCMPPCLLGSLHLLCGLITFSWLSETSFSLV